MSVQILVGSALDRLGEIPDESIHCCVTSPPYWGLRSYKGNPGMIGLEPTWDEHLANLVAVFREVRRVLRKDATLLGKLRGRLRERMQRRLMDANERSPARECPSKASVRVDT